MSQETIASNSLAKMLLITKHTKYVDKSAKPATTASGQQQLQQYTAAQWNTYTNL